MRHNYKLIFFLLLLLLIQEATLQIEAAWLAPHFTDSNTDGVEFLEPGGIQQIRVREELLWPFRLAQINYQGTGTPTLGSFEIGDNGFLGANLSFIDNAWIIQVGKRQDYENPQQRIYSFQIYIKEDTQTIVEHGILLTLENIFDNEPSVSYSPSPCRVEELQSDFLTNCVFRVYDPDGMDRNRIQIRTLNSAQLFDFEAFGETTTYEKNFKLRIRKELHFEEKAIYNLNVTASDANNNTGSNFAIIEVIDLPNRDPVWVRPLTTASFNEKQEQFFSLTAIDGDTGINKPICYGLKFEEDYSDLVTINETSGVLHVRPIDRDALNQQIFSFYTVAYKCDNITWAIKNTTVLIVQDINDHIPEIYLKPLSIAIPESKYLTLPLDNFFIEDVDLGSNGTYKAKLNVSYGPIWNAFELTPNSGYQRANFSVAVTRAELMDFEVENTRSFRITITAIEMADSGHIANRSVDIELINWNDEWPIFDSETYEVTIPENLPNGETVAKVMALDRDVDDSVIHSIVGNIPGLVIDNVTGIISTNIDNAFDYERQKLVLVQVQAKDTLVTSLSSELHTSFAQLSIVVSDINDETPEIRLPRSVVNITENSPSLTMLSGKIEARDVDTTANLTFEILWNSSYVTKSGREGERQDFENCFIIQLEAVSRNLVYGVLRVNDKFDKEIDFELYDTIFLSIRVTDLNQEVNDGSSTVVMTIRVDDVNDNAPEFVMGTLEEVRKVTEMEEKSKIIGTLEAFDVDGPGNNVISFALRPANNLTQEGLVTVNNSTGVLRVNGLIECDVPKVYFLQYEAIVSDTVYQTVGRFNISIADINNQSPMLDPFQQQVSIYENATNFDFVGQVRAHDNDRDLPHNVLEYSISNAVGDILDLFKINTTTGDITVQLRNGQQLDRDNGITYHYIGIEIKDNFDYASRSYGPVNQISTFLNVTLLDVNDNGPIMPLPALFVPEFSEADDKGITSQVQLVAEDNDEMDTPNSWISYRVLSIAPAGNNSQNVANYTSLFLMEGDDRRYGELKTVHPLKGYYGYWSVQIEAYDHGVPVMRNSSTYQVYIRPYNFNAPSIKFPEANKSIRLCYALQEVNRPLYQADCVTHLQPFEAYDPDGGDYGDVSFSLSSDQDDTIFTINKLSRNQSSLYLQRLVPAGVYKLNIRATDGGGRSAPDIRNLKIVFVDLLGNPQFRQSTYLTNFTENEKGLQEERYIPAAFDPRNEGLDVDEEEYPLYYFIDKSVNEQEAELFKLDSETRRLTLVQTLDREAKDTHHLNIIVTNNANGIIANPNSINFTLQVIISVNDENDNPPKFQQAFYAAGVTPKDSVGKEILTVQADDPDLDDTIVYNLIETVLENRVNGEVSNADGFFLLDRASGLLSLNAYVTNYMKGYFMMKVRAEDSAVPSHTDETYIKVYIVAESNRVKFVFLSDVQAIRENAEVIRAEFRNIYGYEICNIDAVNDVTNQRGNRQTANDGFITEVVVHFIHDNEAIDAIEIEQRSSDLAFVSKLQNALQQYNLILNDIPHVSADETERTVAEWMLMSLIIGCLCFATISAILLAVLIIRTRRLKRQLRAFDPPKFSSVASDLNRMSAPINKIFSIEGSNPLFNPNNAPLAQCSPFENESSSDDEDELKDLQDDPTFDMNILNNLEGSQERKKLSNNFCGSENSGEINEDNAKMRY